MEYSRREVLALGGGVGAGLLAGGLLGASAVRRDGDDRGGDAGTPMQRIVGTRDRGAVEAAGDAVVGDEAVVRLGDRRTLVVGPLDPAEARELAAREAVDFVEPDLPVSAADAAVASRSVQPTETPWGVERIRAPAAHGAGYRGDGARVAVVDSGVTPHPDLAGNVGDGVAFVETVRLRRGLTYYVRAHARFPDGHRVLGRRRRLRVPIRGRLDDPGDGRGAIAGRGSGDRSGRVDARQPTDRRQPLTRR